MSYQEQHPNHMVQIPVHIDPLGQQREFKEPKRSKDMVGAFVLFAMVITVFAGLIFLIWLAAPDFGAW